jgi:hypothetical protein
MVDLRRGMVDEGMVPQSLQKPMSALEKRGNPWGKLEKKRAEWTAGVGDGVTVKLVEKGDTAETLYFVDSITSYDDRMQKIAQATARVLGKGGIDFVVIGKDEKDSGHDVRRFGEEMLFQSLKEQNTEAVRRRSPTDRRQRSPCPERPQERLRGHAAGAARQRAHRAVRRERKAEAQRRWRIRRRPTRITTPATSAATTTPTTRRVRPSTPSPGLKRVEMTGNCRDRSFCCGGGGLMLFYEPEEEQRMGVVRVEQAKEAGADVIVTACPYCLTNIEDAIKVAGLEGKMEVSTSSSSWTASFRTEFARGVRYGDPGVCQGVPDSAQRTKSAWVKPGGADIRREDLVYSVNEWDNYAVEEAIQIAERVGGNVTVVSVGDAEAEEIVRREMAMGANQGLLATDAAFEGSDGLGIATILKAAAKKGSTI